jgi:hypothetical protein
VNHLEFDIVYVSCDFGIVQFNLKSMLLVILISSEMLYRNMKDKCIHNELIYAATNNGVRASFIKPNDYKQWVGLRL